jgi:hypothetical protein
MDTQVAAETYRDRDDNVLVPGDRVQWPNPKPGAPAFTGTVVRWSQLPGHDQRALTLTIWVPVQRDGSDLKYGVPRTKVQAILPAREDDAADDDDDAEASDATYWLEQYEGLRNAIVATRQGFTQGAKLAAESSEAVNQHAQPWINGMYRGTHAGLDIASKVLGDVLAKHHATSTSDTADG